ncbi:MULTISPECIES: autotransporter outer membrane beta-barrel domain-containing protein [unclassified Pseudomonas]|uniref:autotransporter outer membrane beta-barrel domain-containing protein n=1 Tax=unclassified Pseudomonas TaxID=196821 RepID=UPI00224B4998|nr:MULTISPECIES: autotransporter outer membrane beta-barrel domain-containing protein [unclassified Pseudomonas]MCX2891039.1 autotransporter outer membrane beta-barrel domain-containing protein [Pseudomonas sp. DCB_BI]
MHPLAQALLLASTFTVSQVAHALTVVDDELSIGAGTPVDSYRVGPGAKLIAENATIESIDVRAGASLQMSGSTVTSDVTDGVALVSATASISGNSKIVSARAGLRLQRSDLVGSTATVISSHVEGAQGGAQLSGNSTLNLQGSTLVGAGTSNAAVLFGNAVLNAQDSTLTGAGAGLKVIGDSPFADAAKVNLVGSTLEGKNGSAIVVGDFPGRPAKADIQVGPGSRLIGSNGTLLEVLGNSAATMAVDGSDLVGDVNVEAGSSASISLDNRASLTGRLINVEALSLANEARWNMVEDSSVGSLAMNAGSVRFGEADQYQRLTVGELSGRGTFIMDADFSTGQTDFLDVTGTATGEHSLLVGSSGADPVTENQLHLVHTASGDAQFSLVNGSVDLGAFSYQLVQRGNDWFLDGSRKVISPGTASVLALANTAPTVWYGELTTLRSRMGEVRRDQGKAGAWARAYGNKFNVSSAAGSDYQQSQQGFSIGADAQLPVGDGQWLAGVMAGHSNSDLNLERGASADVKSYYLGLYATWLDAASGYYFDGVVKLNRFDNSSDVTLSDGKRAKGDYDNLGLGVSAEFGRHIELGDGYFVEPYTQWSAVTIEGKDYRLDNGLQAQSDDTRSLLGKVGATVGRTFDLGQGRFAQPYVRMAYAHEFVNGNDVKVNDNRFDNDLSGSRGELGAGLAVSLNDRLQLHADFDYSNGEHIEQPWGANVGVRYSW